VVWSDSWTVGIGVGRGTVRPQGFADVEDWGCSCGVWLREWWGEGGWGGGGGGSRGGSGREWSGSRDREWRTWGGAGSAGSGGDAELRVPGWRVGSGGGGLSWRCWDKMREFVLVGGGAGGRYGGCWAGSLVFGVGVRMVGARSRGCGDFRSIPGGGLPARRDEAQTLFIFVGKVCARGKKRTRFGRGACVLVGPHRVVRKCFPRTPILPGCRWLE